MNQTFRWLLGLLLLCVMAGCMQRKEGPRKILVSGEGVKINVPEGFTSAVAGIFEDWNFEHAGNGLNLKIREKWNRDTVYFPTELALEFMISKLQIDSNFHFKTINKILPVPLDDITGMFLEGTNSMSLPERALYFVINNHEWFILLSAIDKSHTENIDEIFKNIIRMKLTKLTDPKSYLKQMLRKQENLGEKTLKEIIDYGEQLLNSRDMNVAHYQGAMAEFRKALDIMMHIEPKPVEYGRALRLITIARDLLDEAYKQHSTLYQQAANSMDWQAADKQLKILSLLVGGDPEDPKFEEMKKVKRDFYSRYKRWVKNA